MTRHEKRRSYLIDIEGVLVRDKRYEPVPGSVAWLNGLADRGSPFCLVSNNTTHRPEELIAALNRAGFAVRLEQLVGVLELGLNLLRRWGRTRIMWLGAPQLASYWRDHGFELVREGSCEAVVLGVNRDLTIRDLDRPLAALIDHQAELVALHRNLFYLDETGVRRCGPGTWCAALEPLVHAGQAVCVGKPHERIYREALKRVGTTAAEALFISDDPVADLVTAKRLGMGTAFVLCGKYPDHAVLGRLDQQEWPDIICEHPADLD